MGNCKLVTMIDWEHFLRVTDAQIQSSFVKVKIPIALLVSKRENENES